MSLPCEEDQAMTLSRDQVITGTEAELRRFAELIRSLDDGAWAKDTRCAGWTVADVAAHVTGTLADIAGGRFAELATGNPSERQATERRGRSQKELADELRESAESTLRVASTFDDEAWAGPAPGGLPGTLGEGAEAIGSRRRVEHACVPSASSHACRPTSSGTSIVWAGRPTCPPATCSSAREMGAATSSSSSKAPRLYGATASSWPGSVPVTIAASWPY